MRMQKMEVEIISKETIKPSSPTPAHLKLFKISLIDQLISSKSVEFISFYPKRNSNQEISEILSQVKTSLAETLALYYPLAGVVKDDNLTIECNDQGAKLYTARVDCDMADIISDQPQHEEFHELTMVSKSDHETRSFQILIQMNIFSCGGIAIYWSFWHRIADGATVCAFLKCWASKVRGCQESTAFPDYKSALLFPVREPAPPSFSGEISIGEAISITKRFVFKEAAISTLKAMAASERVPRPTRVETVICFIWKHAMAAAEVICGQPKPSTLLLSVNLRRQMAPPLPDNSVGNLSWGLSSWLDSDCVNKEIRLEELVDKLRSSKQNFRDKVLPHLQTKEGQEALCKFLEANKDPCSNKDFNPHTVSSWCNLGFNEIDFGWGKPIWLSMPSMTSVTNVKNAALLADGCGSEGGIEAWLLMDEREMEALQNDKDFVAYASANPRIIDSESTNF